MRPDRTGEHWVTRKVSTVGVVCVGYQQVCIGQSYAGSACDVLVTDGTLQYGVSNERVKTTLGYRRPRLCGCGRRMACSVVAARVDGHTEFLRQNRIGAIRKRIRI